MKLARNVEIFGLEIMRGVYYLENSPEMLKYSVMRGMYYLENLPKMLNMNAKHRTLTPKRSREHEHEQKTETGTRREEYVM